MVSQQPIHIRAATAADQSLLQNHLLRHRAESGRGDIHFMPFAPGDSDAPAGLNAASLSLALDSRSWQRWFVAIVDGQVVGHVSLKGDDLNTGLHRCELGIGVERTHRDQRIGIALMNTAIDFARSADELSWVDLLVFAHNTRARALYRSLGFIEVATLVDRFRIEGESVDDVVMALAVK